MKRRFVYIIILGLFLALYLVSCKRGGNHRVQGYVEASNLYLASPFSGILLYRPVSRGDIIQKGDLVFKLDPNPEALKLREMTGFIEQEQNVLTDLQKPKRKPEREIVLAQIEQVKARLILAKLRMKRFEELYKKKAGTLDQADAAVQHFNEMLALKKQREEELSIANLGARENIILAQISKIRATKARVRIAQWQLSQKTLHSPETGIVLDTYFQEGEWVPPGKPVASLLVLKYVMIEFFLPANLLPTLKIGQVVEVTCAGCKSKQKAKVSFISPEAEYVPPLIYSEKNYDKLVYKIKARPNKPGLFKPGQPVMVSGF